LILEVRRRLPGLLGALVIGSIAVACGAVASPVAPSAPQASSSPAASAPASPSSPSPSIASEEPPWATALGRVLGCDGPPVRMGAVGSPTDGDGSWVADEPDGVLDGFLAGAAGSYAFLPLDGWKVA
jgi:hypothetical protein